jgi:hypothetical protein
LQPLDKENEISETRREGEKEREKKREREEVKKIKRV